MNLYLKIIIKKNKSHQETKLDWIANYVNFEQ